MFWEKYEKERLKRTYRAKLSQAISRLEKMDMSSLSQVYCAVATEDRKLVQSGGRAIGMVMEPVSYTHLFSRSGYIQVRDMPTRLTKKYPA